MIRWLSFFSGLLMLGAVVLLFGFDNFSPYTHEGIRNLCTHFSEAVRSLPIWSLVVTYVLFILLMCIGVPTVLFFSILLVSYNLWTALILAYLGQLLATFICMRLSYKNYKNENFNGKLYEDAAKLKHRSVSFAFWSRLYFTFPLRSIDALTPVMHSEHSSMTKEFIAAGKAILLRMIIPSLWVNSVYSAAVSLIYSSAEERSMIFWSSALIAYAIIPRAPELIICPERFKEVLFEIGPYGKKVEPKSSLVIQSEASQIEVPEDIKLPEEDEEAEEEVPLDA